MIPVAICDDILSTCEEVRHAVAAFGMQQNFQFDTHVFTTGHSLIERLETQQFEMVFLDIKLNEESGIDVGKAIRQSELNRDAIIIFMSVSDTPASQIVKLKPLEYTLKPVTLESIKDVMTEAMQIVEERNEQFVAQTPGETYHIRLKDILYFESDRRLIHIHTAKETITCYGKLGEIENGIRSSQFIRIHHSYLVNFAHIKSYNSIKLMVTLNDGTMLPISQSRRKTSYAAFSLLLRNKNEP